MARFGCQLQLQLHSVGFSHYIRPLAWTPVKLVYTGLCGRFSMPMLSVLTTDHGRLRLFYALVT